MRTAPPATAELGAAMSVPLRAGCQWVGAAGTELAWAGGGGCVPPLLVLAEHAEYQQPPCIPSTLAAAGSPPGEVSPEGPGSGAS